MGLPQNLRFAAALCGYMQFGSDDLITH